MNATPTWYRKNDPDRATKWERIVQVVATDDRHKHCREYAGPDRPEYAAWLAHVDRALPYVTFADLPDAPLFDWYNDGTTPSDAAEMLMGGEML